MRIRSPSLTELHAFVAVVECGSFSRAAQRLAVTQCAVSRSVMRLEERLGLPLFDRAPGAVRPTATGQSYYARIQPALATLEESVPTRQREESADVLRVSALPSLNMRWLVPRLPSLHREHPWLQVTFKPYLKGDTMQREDVDCYIELRASATSRWPAHVKAHYLLGREMMPICHPDVASRIVRPADLLQWPLLHHANYPDNWRKWFEAQGVDARRIKLDAGFDLTAGLIEAVAARMGVAVVPACLIERELAERRVAVPLALPVSFGRGYYLCTPKAAADTPAMQAFRQWLLAQSVRTPV
jgi:LysR family transcriptional regulator, glycine cleavage system transcriptional activator